MSTIWSIPTGVLLFSVLIIFLINRRNPNIGTSWFVAILAGTIVWGWTISLYFRPDIKIIPLSESIPGILEESGIYMIHGDGLFILDGISYPYMLAITTLLIVLLLTAPSYIDPRYSSRLWFFYLLIEAIAFLCVSANNIIYMIYGWVIFDAIDLVVHYLTGQIRRSVLTAIGVRFIGTMLAAASIALSNSETGSEGAFISLKAGAFLLTACALRMGIIPVSQPYTEMSNTRVGLGTMLRLVSVLTVMPVLSRIPLGGLQPNLRFILVLASAFSSFTGSVGWLLSENSFSGVSYAVLGISGMAFYCALNREQGTLVMWGVSIALTCAPLSLYQIHNRFMNLLAFFVVLCFSGLPYMPNAFGWLGLVDAAKPFQNIIFILIQMLLIGGAFIHILRTEDRKFSDLEPWMRSVYPMGFITAAGIHIFISMISFEEPFSLGEITASSISFAGAVLLTLFFRFMPERGRTQNAAAWGRAGMSFFWKGMKKLMDMEWLINFSMWIGRFFEVSFKTINAVLENNGGLIWELLLLALLIAAAFSGVGK